MTALLLLIMPPSQEAQGQTLPSLTNGLVAYYMLDGNGNDSSSSSNHGAVINLKSGTNRFMRPGRAIVFDGSGYVDISNQRLLDGATEATIAGWVLLHSSNQGGFIVGAGDSRSGLDPFSVAVAPWSGRWRWAQRSFNDSTLGSHPQRFVGVDDWQASTNLLNVDLGRWIHFAQTFRSSGGSTDYNFFVDGRAVQSYRFNYSFRIRYDRNMPVQIGALTSFSNSRFRGIADDVRFYNRALSADEVLLLYSTESVPPTPSLSVEVIRVRVKLGLTPGLRYLLESSTDLIAWTQTGPPFVSSSSEEAQEFEVTDGSRYFRVTQVP
jgi:hypothetical protein